MPTIMAGSLVLTVYCTTLLISTADEHGNEFSEIAFKAYGGWAKKVTQICIICSQMGFCINYIYFIMANVGSVINCIVNESDVCNDSKVVNK